MHATSCYIFITNPFSLCMPLVATFLSQFLLVCAWHYLLHVCACHFSSVYYILLVHATNCYMFVTINVWGGKIRIKLWGSRAREIMWFRHRNYIGACFQASHCHTWTMTNGNALCSLIGFVYQHVTSTRPYKVMYLQYEQYN